VIPRAEILRAAEDQGLFATTIEKDYALGWVLFGIAAHPEMSRWSFKGGTCLKKCYFNTYRFSEDLDFTLPDTAAFDGPSIIRALQDVGRWVEDASGIVIPADGIEIEQLTNQQGAPSFQGKLTFQGPLSLASRQQQRIKFDLTRHELLVGPSELHPIFHGYSDAPSPVPEVTCYHLDEIVAEKVRALVERSGRARDVYDIVNIARNFRSDVSPQRVQEIAARKFEFKGLPAPSVDTILAKVDPAVLEVDWNNALRHQLQALPPSSEFLAALRQAVEWLLGVERPEPVLNPVPLKAGERIIARARYAGQGLGGGAPVERGGGVGAFGSRMERVRFAARNRLLAQVNYHGIDRLVEPYSLRIPNTGNLLLYVNEVRRGTGAGEGIKAFKVDELGDVKVTDQPFVPRYRIEL
jgi:predicted nucleotidyltransferase component of viral defense system